MNYTFLIQVVSYSEGCLIEFSRILNMNVTIFRSAWWCFPFEAMESLSVHLMWVAAATYCAVIAPRGLLATLIGVCGMAHYSIGRGSGSFVGGHLIGKFGIRQSFKLMGLVGVCSGFLYAFLHYTWLKTLIGQRDEKVVSCK